MGWSRGIWKRTPLLGGWGFSGIRFWDAAGSLMGGEKIAPHTLPEGYHFLDLTGPDQVQKMANSGTCFENTRIM